MRIAIVTLFPEVFTYLEKSIIKRARDKGLVEFIFINPRDFTTDRHRTVDDIPYGGGAGMVLKPEPMYKAVFYIRNQLGLKGNVVLTTPQGSTFNQDIAKQLSEKEEIIFICGHYEGFDERIRKLADMEISIGDYVLSGGELAAQVIIDSVVRLIPGAIDEESAANESFSSNLLDFPHYTRPPVFEGMAVPEVLLSGHHKKIEEWRKKEAIRRTLVRRPDLIEKTVLSDKEMKILDEVFKEELESGKSGSASDSGFLL
ncbi:MAG: tRNA (guanosine(37)-N1)-methyltransferase TrmD [Firmicutes bacterium]|nr:tRNA (guanosine(37)-N1)-methyltransferase TrmD [Bacillota bacterium]